jgi:hypothetical protein
VGQFSMPIDTLTKTRLASATEIDTVAQILRESMIDAGKMYLRDVPIVVDVSVVDNWYEK